MTERAHAKAGRREWIGLAVIALPCLLYSMDLTVLNLAVPQLSADLRPSAAELLWIIDIYGFMVAGALIPMGALGDRIGRRRLLLVGAAAFGVASVLAAFSTTTGMLIAMRALLGLAGATIAPSTLSLIRSMFHDPHERTVAIGVWVTSYSVGGAIGPLVGGILLQHFWWGSVFLAAVPVMVLLLILGPVLLPEYRDPNEGLPDLPSVLLSLVAVLTTIYALKRLAEGGDPWLWSGAAILGVGIGWSFARRQHAITDPLVDPALFKLPTFTAALGVYTIGTFVVFGVYVILSQYLQLVLGLDPLRAGLITIPSMFAFVGGSILVPRLARKFPPTILIPAGLGCAALGFALLGAAPIPAPPWLLVVGTVVYAFGITPVVVLTTDIIVGSAPVARAGAASAISETSSELGGALGIAVLGSLATVVFRAGLPADLLATLPAESAAAARATIAGALSVAEEVGGATGAELLTTARLAFGAAFRATTLVAAVTSAAGALLFLALRPAARAETA